MMIRIAISCLSLIWLSACSRSFCGAPCEKPKPRPVVVKHRDKPAVLVNQYGSIHGHIEIDSMTEAQLETERTSLESLLSQDEQDAEILKVLKEGKLDTANFDYNDYSTGGSRFNASGKLRRDAAVKDSVRQLPRRISESQNRELIERYRHVRRRLASFPAEVPEPEREIVAVADTVPPPPDSLWSGFYRVNGDTLVPSKQAFPELEACESWARGEAERYRRKAYAFEYVCRKRPGETKRKLW